MSEVFDAYAAYYDLLYQDKDYQQEAHYLKSLLTQHAQGASSILELGCGTGAHAEYLARQGFTVHGIDMSEAMVAQANERKKSLPADIAERLSFAVGDVRTYQTDQCFDVVISLFHVVSYQTSNADLKATLTTADKHLSDGGLFIFDYWYGPSVLSDQPEVRVKRLENDNIHVTRIAEPVIHLQHNIVDVNYTVIVKNKENGSTETLTEKHPMRYLFTPELDYFAEQYFDSAKHFAWMTEESPNEKVWAAVSILKKGS